MSDEWERQRDIDAEGQRAAIFHAERNLPQERGRDRHIGMNPQGVRVNNVTRANRLEVDKSKPWLQIQLANEDITNTIALVWIPNTRERPDVVMFDGKPYEVYDTARKLPIYKQCLVATAHRVIPDQEGS